MTWQYVEYTYPIEVWFEKMILWLDSVSRLYFAIKARDEDDWTFFSGNAAHGLAAGELLVNRSTVEADAQTNYWRPTPDADNRILGVLPGIQSGKYVRVYIDDANDNPTQIYEFRPSTYFAADEIITGHLRITDAFALPPLITITKSSVDRIKIGNFTGATFGLIGYDVSSNVIFELSDARQVIAGWALTQYTITCDSGVVGINSEVTAGTDWRFWAGHATPGSAPFRVDESGNLFATSAIISGAVSAATIDIGGDDATSFHVDIAGGIWSGASIANKATAPFRVSNTGALVATSATITGAITATSGTIAGFTVDPTEGLYAGTGATQVQMKPGAGIWTGATAIGDAPFSATNAGVLKAVSGTIGGWILGTTLLQSAASDARIVLDQGKLRVSIFDASNEKVVMGYLDDLVRNNGVGTASAGAASTLTDSTKDWQVNEHASLEVTITGGTGSGQTRTISSNTATVLTVSAVWGTNPDATSTYEIRYTVADYGFWAKAGDTLNIDGDVIYSSGDWIIQHDSSYLIQDGSGNNIIRLGTDTGEKGLFIYDTSANQLAKFLSTGSVIGQVAASQSNISITSGAIQLRTNTTVNAELTNAGILILGDDAGGEYVTIASTGLQMFGNAAQRVEIASDGTGWLGTNAGITWDASGNITVAGTITVGSFAALPPDEHLVGYWAFDDGSGTVAVDGSGNGNNGTLPADNWGAGYVGKAGIVGSNYFSAPISASAPMTLTLWFKVTTNTDEGVNAPLFKLYQDDTNYIWFYLYSYGVSPPNNPGVPYLQPCGYVTSYFHQAYNFLAGQWYFAVFKLATNQMFLDIYKDGVVVDSRTSPVDAGFASYNFNSLRLYDFGSDCYYDETRTYNRTLTEAEIKALYLYPAGNKGTRISGNQITTGAIQSTNWAPAAGMQIDLNNAKITVRQAEGLTIDSATGIKVLAGGDITLAGHDTNTAILKWAGTKDISFGANTAGSYFGIWPETAGEGFFGVGWIQNAASGAEQAFDKIWMSADNQIYLMISTGGVYEGGLYLSATSATLAMNKNNALNTRVTCSNSESVQFHAGGVYAGYFNSTKLVVNGNVIIGDSASTYKVRVLSTGTALLQLESTDAGAVGVIQEYYHNSASPLVADVIAKWSMFGNNSAAAKKEYWRIYCNVTDVTSTSEDATLSFAGIRAGTLTQSFKFLSTGSGQADLEWVTFSPDIKKGLQKIKVTADDYLNWALEDAKKPLKPYKGLFNKDNIPVGCTVKSSEEEMEKYGKGLGKIAIGVAHWAEDANKRIKQLEQEVEFLKAA